MYPEDPLDYMCRERRIAEVQPNGLEPTIGRSARKIFLPKDRDPNIPISDYYLRAGRFQDLLDEAKIESPDHPYIDRCQRDFEELGNLTPRQIIFLKEIADPYFWVGEDKYRNLERELLVKPFFPKVAPPPSVNSEADIDRARSVAENLRLKKEEYYRNLKR